MCGQFPIQILYYHPRKHGPSHRTRHSQRQIFSRTQGFGRTMLRRVWNNSSRSALLESQQSLLEHFVRAPLASHSHVLNYVDSETQGDVTSGFSDAKTVVMAHGFGSGLGFFFPNYDAIFEHPQVKRVLGVDWLGMGGSPRPSCRAAPRVSSMQLCNSKFSDTQAVEFFIDSLEEWRNTIGLEEKFILVGHSLGGYLSARYALKYPERVEALLLVSPVGFPETRQDELSGENTGNETIARNRLDLIDALWSANFTPQDILRVLGPRGKSTVRSILRRRFDNRWNTFENDLIADYLFHISVAKASGEYALNSILKPVLRGSSPGVYAKQPLVPLFSQILVPKVTVLFGDHDWLRSNAAAADVALSNLKSRRPQADVNLKTIPQAGHHIYLDNPTKFHTAFAELLE